MSLYRRTEAKPHDSPGHSLSSSKSDEKRLQEFGRAIDAIHQRHEADLGERDLEYILRICRISRNLERVGRSLIHVSFEPLGFTSGIIALWIHRQLEATEIGHMALHGAFDKLGERTGLQSKTFRWKFPVDEESWRHAHNTRHHPFTNVVGKDPDIHFGFVRLTKDTPHRSIHFFQLPIFTFFIIPNFGSAINTHVTGLLDVYLGNGLSNEMDFLEDRTLSSALNAHRKAFRKWAPYYAENYILYPALAGPFFWKVMLGNWLAEKLRDIYTGVTVLCGHVGSDVKSYPDQSRSANRGLWYARQVEAANNFKVSRPLSILCGALDYQIEHHLFPRLPPNRLRDISQEVEACCQEYGIRYKSDTWPKTIMKAFTQIARLSLK